MLAVMLAMFVALCACSSTPSTGVPRLLEDPEAAAWRERTANAKAADDDGKRPAVTHLGRTMLPRAGVVVLGRSTRVTQAVGGVEIARFSIVETLRAMPWDRPEGDEITVFCGEAEMLPRPGQEAVLLVARRPGSPNHDVIQSIVLVGSEGAERLEALRAYLRIEAIADEDERVAALLDHLRATVRDPRRWTRANAALEYGSLARARPDDLSAEDAAVLRPAAARAADPDTRRSLLSALEKAERNARAPVAVAGLGGGDAVVGTGGGTGGGPADDGAAAADLLERFAAAEDPLVRRAVVVEAAVTLGAAGAPVFGAALGDANPQVREAAIAAAGQWDVRDLGPRIVPFLSREGEPLPLRRSAVRSVGLLRVRDAVPLLATVAGAPTPLGEDACFALARVRDTEAVAALGALLGTADGDRRELLEFLLSERFVEQEERLGRK